MCAEDIAGGTESACTGRGEKLQQLRVRNWGAPQAVRPVLNRDGFFRSSHNNIIPALFRIITGDLAQLNKPPGNVVRAKSPSAVRVAKEHAQIHIDDINPLDPNIGSRAALGRHLGIVPELFVFRLAERISPR